MDILEIKKEKENLEKEILRVITMFEGKTGLDVNGFESIKETVSGVNFTVGVVLDVKI